MKKTEPRACTLAEQASVLRDIGADWPPNKGKIVAVRWIDGPPSGWEVDYES